jgi:hypothetical protein
MTYQNANTKYHKPYDGIEITINFASTRPSTKTKQQEQVKALLTTSFTLGHGVLCWSGGAGRGGASARSLLLLGHGLHLLLSDDLHVLRLVPHRLAGTRVVIVHLRVTPRAILNNSTRVVIVHLRVTPRPILNNIQLAYTSPYRDRRGITTARWRQSVRTIFLVSMSPMRGAGADYFSISAHYLSVVDGKM